MCHRRRNSSSGTVCGDGTRFFVHSVISGAAEGAGLAGKEINVRLIGEVGGGEVRDGEIPKFSNLYAYVGRGLARQEAANHFGQIAGAGAGGQKVAQGLAENLLQTGIEIHGEPGAAEADERGETWPAAEGGNRLGETI